jgi:hypothetical protein
MSVTAGRRRADLRRNWGPGQRADSDVGHESGLEHLGTVGQVHHRISLATKPTDRVQITLAGAV